MIDCTKYWKKRAELAEKFIDGNQIGDWKNWKEFQNIPIVHRIDLEGNCQDCKEKVLKKIET